VDKVLQLLKPKLIYSLSIPANTYLLVRRVIILGLVVVLRLKD
jgi:hypothetical protein